MVTPPSYSYQSNYTAVMKNYNYGNGKKSREFDIEYAVLKVIMKQLEAVREVEELR
jgi:hypothetical protein